MNGPPIQGIWEIEIAAAVADVWAVLEDSKALPRWCAFFVKDTTGGLERLGAVRQCTLEDGGRRGQVFERCVEFTARQRIMWTMEQDTFGMTRLLDGFTFGFTLLPHRSGGTTVRFEQRWRPRTLMTRILMALVMRRRMDRTNRRLLEGLKEFVERGGPTVFAGAVELATAGVRQGAQAPQRTSSTGSPAISAASQSRRSMSSTR